jgi:protein-S-isoprenylcysteine O-methyltransferase Ste14
MNVPRKYGLVRAIAFVLKLIAVIVLVLGIVGFVGSLLWGNQVALPRWATVGGALAAPLAALLIFVQLYAFGSILSLLVKIEENTRGMIPPRE